MQNLHTPEGDRQREALNIALEAARIPVACSMYGLSRSRLYLLAGEGKIKLVKAGNATLVDLASLRAWFAGLPAATVTVKRKPAAAHSVAA